MSKKGKRTMDNAANNEVIKSAEGGDTPAVHSTEQVVQGAEHVEGEHDRDDRGEQSVLEQIEAQEEGEFREKLREEEQERETAPVVTVSMGIGQFCRHLLLNNQKLTNTEVLKRVLLVFPDAKTTMACIAWYKTDLRKKGQLPQGGGNRSGGKHIELSAEQLAELCK
jgi:hypothetical protein